MKSTSSTYYCFNFQFGLKTTMHRDTQLTHQDPTHLFGNLNYEKKNLHEKKDNFSFNLKWKINSFNYFIF